jgi:acetylglutamate kinase
MKISYSGHRPWASVKMETYNINADLVAGEVAGVARREN